MPASLDFHFDFISPYAWFASLRIEEIAGRHGRAVEWHPILLGVSVMKVMGLKPLMATPLKGEYARRDIERYARRHGLTIDRDLGGPQVPLTMGRAFAFAAHRRPALQAALAHAIFNAYWVQGLDIDTPESLRSIALPQGIDADWLVQGAAGAEAAALLRQSVDRSLAAGVFGSPTVVVDGEPFWGSDRLDDVDEWLTRGGW